MHAEFFREWKLFVPECAFRTGGVFVPGHYGTIRERAVVEILTRLAVFIVPSTNQRAFLGSISSPDDLVGSSLKPGYQ